MVDVSVPYLQTPAVLVNEAIDALGASGEIIGAITDGTVVAETARRNYGQALRQLLRTAHWDFARAREKLTLLGDATGASAPPVSPLVECPFQYAYAWPTSAVAGRWLPWNPTGGQPTNAQGTPLTTGVSAAAQYAFTPGRFLVSSSSLYPIQTGVQPWSELPDLQRTEGLGPTYRKIILTDCMNAEFVFTRLVTTIEEFDSLFRQALVTMLAMVIAPVAIKDAKLRLAEMGRLVPLLKNAIADARVASGRESGYPISTDFDASFIRARNAGASWTGLGLGSGFGPLGGGFGLGYEGMSWCGYSVY